MFDKLRAQYIDSDTKDRELSSSAPAPHGVRGRSPGIRTAAGSGGTAPPPSAMSSSATQRVCRYGGTCRRADCIFAHPGGQDVNDAGSRARAKSDHAGNRSPSPHGPRRLE
eukprot:1572700-Pyramimonas_sp.AAC.1